MSKLFACIISGAEKADLAAIAGDFSAKIEIIEGGVLFDVSGLENLMGDQTEIAKRIASILKEKNIRGNLGVSANAESAVLFAKNIEGVTTDTGQEIKHLFIEALELDADIQNVFSALGLKNIDQLKDIPESDLIARYGQDFRAVIDLIDQKGKRTLIPNIKEQNIEWNFELEHSVKELERLVFIIANGVSEILGETVRRSLSTENITVVFTFEDAQTKTYEIKISFPTVQKNFWRRIIDHRISQDLPEKYIASIRLICHFTKPRSAQFGLYSATRPEPESLHLTVNKIKNLVGEESVGVPVLLDQRLHKPFRLDPHSEPKSVEDPEIKDTKLQIAFSHFKPPIPAFVWIKNRKLMYLKTRYFEGKVKEHGGIWRANSHWWAGFWSTEEWDVEVEDHGVFRLSRKGREWFVSGEYD
ncbi:MAG: hypothetical protein KDB79_05280 [Acidobacteria bacterium]|nr:hypothetical protein [Acidobacteriota bacterium]